VRRCRECGSLYAATARTAGSREYESYYHDANLEVPPVVHRRLAKIVDGFGRFRETNRWLDVGCGAGALLDAAAKAGWEAEGTEVASAAVERLAARGRTVFAGDLEELRLPEGGYDVVSLVEVLEHLPDPLSVVRRTAVLLRPGGVAYVTTPHARGMSARALGLRWSLVAPPEHLQLFSRRGLRALFSRAGLMVDRCRTEGLNPYELRAALLCQQAATGLQRVEASYQLNTALHSRRGGLLARGAVNAALNATRLGDSLKCAAVKPNG
jgi:SAM-dependent methyltransferase